MAQEGPRNIVLFSDGTGNSAASLFKTNVRRLYEALDLTDPVNPEEPRQFAFYDDGVGTSGFKPLAVLGGAFGFGLTRNVKDLYGFLCRSWRPGDSIYGFGFSRGGFTIRVVAGLVLNQGIIPYTGDEALFARRIADAYRAYRAERYGKKEKGRTRMIVAAARAVRDAGLRLKRRLCGQEAPGELPRPSGESAPERLHIAFLGVWDTVDAYGLPFEELTRAIDAHVWPLTLPDADLHPHVVRAAQALSLDEERQTFLPRLWNEEKPGDAARITQVWFAGVHADIGGGYPDAGLSYIPLGWMVRQARNAGLRFCEDILAQQRALSDANGPIHDPRRGLGGYYRYRPRDVLALTTREQAAKFKPRVLVARPKIHEAVFRRIRDGQDGYAPVGLPPVFDVLRQEGDLVPGDAFLRLAPGARPQLNAQQQLVWNRAVLRRVVYYLTFLATAAFVVMPLWASAESCSSPLCFASPLVRMAGAFLPGFAAPWVEAMATNPAVTLVQAALLLAALLAGSLLKTAIADTMRRAWYALVPHWRPRQPPRPADFAGPVAPGPLDRYLGETRASPRIERVRQWLTRDGVPLLALFVTAYLGLALLNGAVFAVAESAGLVCKAGAGIAPEFDTRSLCHRLDQVAQPGVTYRITLEVPRRVQAAGEAPGWFSCAATTPGPLPRARSWSDCAIPASPNGIDPNRPSSWQGVLQSLAVPFRRHTRQPWFQLMIRLGDRGSDSFPANWRLVRATGAADSYEATFTAYGAGPIFLYVNDAVPVLWPGLFYANNRGTARVTVAELSRDRP